MWKLTTFGLAVISLVGVFTCGVLVYKSSIEAEEQLQLIHAQADSAQAQIIEIRTPRRMEPETKIIFAARIVPYTGQKYDMKVFRDQDSLELASVIQSLLFLISDRVETERTYEARVALQDALIEAGLYDDSSAFTSISCVEVIEPIQVGTQITPIPCSESSI